MTRSVKLLIGVLVAVAATAAFWFLVVSPKREQIAQLDQEITSQQAAAAQAEQQAVTYKKAKGNYPGNYRTIARLGKAVPADDDVRSLLVQLDDAASRSKVDFRSLNVTGGGAGPDDDVATPGDGKLAPAPGSVAVGSAGVTAMPFTFGFDGSFFRLSDFFAELERFVTVQNSQVDVTGRLLLLGSIAVTPEEEDGSLSRLQAEIGAAAYIVPPAEAVPGAPSVSVGGPAGTTAPSSTPTTPPTTATVTGVR